MTVYVVQKPQRRDARTGEIVDLFPGLEKAAREFGEVRYLLSPTAAPWRTESAVRELNEKLQNYGDDDHLLLVGNPVLIGLTVAIAADWNDGRVTCLQWSGKERRYIVVSAVLD